MPRQTSFIQCWWTRRSSDLDLETVLPNTRRPIQPNDLLSISSQMVAPRDVCGSELQVRTVTRLGLRDDEQTAKLMIWRGWSERRNRPRKPKITREGVEKNGRQKLWDRREIEGKSHDAIEGGDSQLGLPLHVFIVSISPNGLLFPLIHPPKLSSGVCQNLSWRLPLSPPIKDKLASSKRRILHLRLRRKQGGRGNL
ncbi:hypothetical protein C8J56DRAFT_988266 [Mycena floridula]|nr:hypothetical protein C8J56DRAFT_988266 [Mycena floridula]